MPISATNYDGTQNYSVAEMDDLAKPNLLVNADFRFEIINQSGKESFERVSTNSYTIDEWILHPKVREASLYVQDGQIVIYQNNASGQARDGGQDINIVQHVRGIEQGKTYHLHFKYNSVEYDCNIPAGSSTTNVTINTNILIAMAYVSKGHYTLAINVKNKNANIFNFMKLEEGLAYTGMPKWDEGKELNDCMRKYQRIEYNGIPLVRYKFEGGASYFMGFPFRTVMAKIPTVKTLQEKNGISLSYQLSDDRFTFFYAQGDYTSIEILKAEMDSRDY